MQMKKITFSFALHSLIRTFAGHLHSIDMDLRIKESDLRQPSAEGAEAVTMAGSLLLHSTGEVASLGVTVAVRPAVSAPLARNG